MYLQYDNFSFNPGEAFPAFFGQQRRYNQRGRAQSVVKRLQVQGEIVANGQDAINTRAGQILSALELEGGTVVFKKDGGGDTHIKLASAGSFGVRILQNTLEMQEARAHFATALPFSITFEAEYPVSDGDPIVDYRETIGHIGTGGPRHVFQELDEGAPVEQWVSTHSPVTIIQQGFSVGYSGYLTFPEPLYPAAVDQPDGYQHFRDNPEVSGLAFINWPIRWSYRMTLSYLPPVNAPPLE